MNIIPTLLFVIIEHATVYLFSISWYIYIITITICMTPYAKVSGRSGAENLYYGKTQIDGT